MVLRQRLMEQMESRMQVEDEELRDLIDMAILEAAEGAYLPLKERLCLRKELFDSFRRLIFCRSWSMIRRSRRSW